MPSQTETISIIGIAVLTLGLYLIISAMIGVLDLYWSTITGYTYAYSQVIAFLVRLTPLPTLSYCGSSCDAGGSGFAFLFAVMIIAGLGIIMIAAGWRIKARRNAAPQAHLP